jgi:hypothetical protein
MPLQVIDTGTPNAKNNSSVLQWLPALLLSSCACAIACYMCTRQDYPLNTTHLRSHTDPTVCAERIHAY